MTNDRATRRYLGVLVPATIVFLGASFALKAADNADILSPLYWIVYSIAVLWFTPRGGAVG